MRRCFRLLFTYGLAFLFCQSTTVFAQTTQAVIYPDDPFFLKKQFIPKTYHPEHITKKPGHYTITDWDEAIDNTWGWGLPVSQKLSILETFWQTMDEDFACFVELPGYYPELWDDLRTSYRTEILMGDPTYGVSQGRFAGIMNYLAMALIESHTNAEDKQVCWYTYPDPGVPLLVCGGWGTDPHFGAGLTPLGDNTLLVYKTVENHPLGLEPGDRVLGYDGLPWTDLYHELLTAQLPMVTWWWGSSEYTLDYSFMVSAGMNWHLFDTMDVLKYSTGETVHLSTSPLEGAGLSLQITEQLDIPGVPIPDMASGERVAFGIVDGTQIGYIYVMAWSYEAETEFYNALVSLMNDYETTGLIIDYRTNYGGWFVAPMAGFSLLYNTRELTVDRGERCSTNNQTSMCSMNFPGSFTIPGNSSNYYDKPIAVLVGPGAVSVGDQAPLWMKTHPMVRLFGRPTAGAYTAVRDLNLGNSNWYSRYTRVNHFPVDDPGNYLTHTELQVDEEVWLTPDDVALGNDTVVEAAKTWINSFAGLQPDISFDPANIDVTVASGQTVERELTLANDGSRELFYSLTPETGNRLWLESDGDNRVLTRMPPREFDLSANMDLSKPGAAEEPQLPPVIAGHGGPDSYGYIWTDSDQPFGPSYEWIDISEVGNSLTMGDDVFNGPIEIGFDFPFYENSYPELYISSNGIITFGSGSVGFNNVPIPLPTSPNNLIALWWDDLDPSSGGVIYYYYDEDTERFIISFVQIPAYYYGGAYTFQVVLHPDGQIDLNYETMIRGGNYALGYATIGIENSNGSDGLEIVYNAYYMHDYLTIKILTDWMGITPYSGHIAPGENAAATITFNAGDLPLGTYTGNIHLESNDPGEPSVIIPVSFEVVGGCEYEIGDFNGSGVFNVADIIDSFSKLKTGLPDPAYLCECPYGGDDEWAVAMDLNNSCDFNIADIIWGFGKLRGLPNDLVPCEDCPPTGRILAPDRKGQRIATPILKLKEDMMLKD